MVCPRQLPRTARQTTSLMILLYLIIIIILLFASSEEISYISYRTIMERKIHAASMSQDDLNFLAEASVVSTQATLHHQVYSNR